MGIKSTIEIELNTKDKKEIENAALSAINRTLDKFPNEQVAKLEIITYLYSPKHKIIESDVITNE